MEELKACPLCGEPLTVRKSIVGGEEHYVAYCHCGFEFADDCSIEDFIERCNRRAAPENKGCADCSGIVYRQTSSGKIIPADQRCGAKITPPCYQPDGDGCAYQIYGDNNDEPIDRCKACPLCYSDKVRHTAPENKALTLEQLRQKDGEPVWIVMLDGSEPTRCEIVVECYKDGIKMASTEDTDDYGAFDLYGETWIAYARRPEDVPSERSGKP